MNALPPNWLVLRIAPDEGISLQFAVKRPGPVVDLAAVKMDFRYDDWFPKEPNVGYETLIYDVMIGDPTLFMRADMVEHAGAWCSRCLTLGPRRGRAACRSTPPVVRVRARRMSFWREMADDGGALMAVTRGNRHDQHACVA